MRWWARIRSLVWRLSAARVARSNLDVAKRQLVAQSRAYVASAALLAKYVVTAPIDGTILSIQAGPGSYVSPQGAYNTYTQAMGPPVVMGGEPGSLEVRAYIDEILIPRLQDAAHISAVMFIRGTNVRVPLTFSRIQPYVSPKIKLSDERQELVDVRVLPVIFRFVRPRDVTLFPGQLVDVYVSAK